MQDHYKILGVDRNANPDTIKKAYRKLASTHHPDKGGDKNKFQEIEAAYRTLSDPNLKAQYDNPSPFGPQGFSGFSRNDSPFDMDAIFNMFGARFHHGHQQQPRRAQMQLWVTLQDIALGGTKTVTVGTQHGTHAVEIEVPKGIEDGDNVQYHGIGPGGMDLIVIYRIHPNPKWQRQGLNLIADETISVWDLILGADITVRDVLGNSLELSIPPGTQPGNLLRLRGRGLTDRHQRSGDLLVRIQVQIPENIDPELLELIRKKKPQ